MYFNGKSVTFATLHKYRRTGGCLIILLYVAQYYRSRKIITLAKIETQQHRSSTFTKAFTYYTKSSRLSNTRINYYFAGNIPPHNICILQFKSECSRNISSIQTIVILYINRIVVCYRYFTKPGGGQSILQLNFQSFTVSKVFIFCKTCNKIQDN